MVESILQPAINLGLSEASFWDMTIAEIDRFMNGAIWRMKQQAQYDYTLASLITNGVACVLGGGEFATIEKAYPYLFGEEKAEPEETANEVTVKNSVNRFLAFAQQHNAKIQKGV